MQIVVNVPDSTYNDLRYAKQYNPRFLSDYEKMILSGTPLPKGHGRLCDLDAALKCMEEVADDKSSIKECAIGFFDWACSKRVILEADKEAENESK